MINFPRIIICNLQETDNFQLAAESRDFLFSPHLMTNERFDPVPIKNRNRFEWSHTEDAVTVRGGRTTLMWASGSIFNRKPTKLHIKFPLLCYRGEIFTTQDTRQRPVCCGQGGAAAALAHTRLGTDLNQTGDIASRSLFLNEFRLFFTICWLSNCLWTMGYGLSKDHL